MLIDGPIQLRKTRDFGQIFSDTFAFLRQEWRPLARAIAAAGLPAAVVGGALAGGSVAALQLMQIGGGASPGKALTSLMGLVPGMLLLMAAWILVVAVVHEYLRAYHLGEHHGLGTGELLKRGLREAGSYFGVSFFSGLLTGFALLLCILPAIYPATVLSLALTAHAIERTGATGSLGRSNELVRGDFWPTFLVLLVMFILKAIVDQVVVLPFTIAGLVIGFNSGMEAISSDEGLQLPAWLGVFNAVSTAVQWCVQMLTYPIVAVACAMKYFSRVEETEGTGLRERIAGFGEQ